MKNSIIVGKALQNLVNNIVGVSCPLLVEKILDKYLLTNILTYYS